MAEIAGLVIGGVALAGLVDSSLNLMSRVSSGRAFESAYQDAALEITMLSARLARWEKTYRANPDPNATEEQGELAENALMAIRKRLDDAYELGVKYEKEEQAQGSSSRGSSTAVINKPRLNEKLKFKLGLDRHRPASQQNGVGLEVTLVDRTKWALKDKDKMDELVLKISRLVANIEKIFPSLESALLRAAQEEARAIQPSEIQEPEEAIFAIRQSAVRVDPRLEHSVRDLQAFEDAVVHVGDRYDSGFAGGKDMPQAYRANIDRLTARGNARDKMGMVRRAVLLEAVKAVSGGE
ncbi:hypothetical protein LTR95_013226 [Oleoguttula sp. CCFEE 5521]